MQTQFVINLYQTVQIGKVLLGHQFFQEGDTGLVSDGDRVCRELALDGHLEHRVRFGLTAIHSFQVKTHGTPCRMDVVAIVVIRFRFCCFIGPLCAIGATNAATSAIRADITRTNTTTTATVTATASRARTISGVSAATSIGRLTPHRASFLVDITCSLISCSSNLWHIFNNYRVWAFLGYL